jgi:hypothetical protein
MFYRDYFKINQEYTSCMTRDAINHDARTWLSFYPHPTFVSLLKNLLESLDGGHKSLWLVGPYGTGKSHAALVLQKLFMDDESRVKEWLEMRKALVSQEVANALMKQRAEKTLVVFDSGATGIHTPEQFLVRIQNAIIDALKEKGCTIPSMGDLAAIEARIEEEEASFFKKRDELQGQLAHLTSDIKSAAELKKRLANKDLVSGLLSDVMTVLHARSIYLNLSAANLVKWVKDALAANGIPKLVFIWDEFSTYLEQNRNELKTFEEIAEAAQEGQFFFMPVTHMNLTAYMAAGSDSAKKANDRFKFCQLDMPTNTALLLAADAIKVTNAAWDDERDKLWHDIQGVVQSYMVNHDQDCQANPMAFKGILPIHPMAAFVLKFLSTVVGSNQRSMFNYLKGEVGTSEFQTFIAEGGPDITGMQFLTVDYLWRYFIERSDLGLIRDVNDVRAEFAAKAQGLTGVEQRVFKTVLLYSLLGRLTNNIGNALIQPTVENIVRSFEGDGYINNVKSILEDLQKKHCFSIINGRCETFHAAGDNEDLQKKIAQYELQFNEQFLVPKAQPKLASKVNTFKDKLHFEVRAATPDKALAVCQKQKDQFGEDGNKVLLQFILAKDQEQQLTVGQRAKELAKQMKDFRMLFVVVPELHFCSLKLTNWKEYVEQLAHKELAVDQAARTNYETQLKLMDGEWLNKLVNNSQKLQVIQPNPNGGEPYVEDRQWNTLEDLLKKYLATSFEFFLDSYSGYNVNSMQEGGHGLQAWAKAGIDRATAQGAMKNVWLAFDKNGITADDAWFAANPSHPLVKLREFCKSRLNNALNGSTGTCSIRKMLIYLHRAPFGLLYVPYTAFVMGIAMRDWLNNPRQQLQWTNGSMSEKLDIGSLSEMIEAAVRDAGNGAIKNEKLICRMSKEEKTFIEKAPAMFGTPHLANATVEATLAEIGDRLEKVSDRAPLWVLPDYIDQCNEPSADVLREIIENVCAAEKISSKGDQQERTARVKKVGELVAAHAGVEDVLRKYIDGEAFDAAFKNHIDKACPKLPQLAAAVGDTTGQYCKTVKAHFATTASWLWNQQNVDGELGLVCDQYKVVAHMQKLLASSVYMSYADAMERLRKAMYEENKIAIAALAGDYPFLVNFEKLMENANVADGMKEFAALFEAQLESLRALFFDPSHAIQIGVVKKHFAAQIGALGEAELKDLYAKLSPGAKRTESDFKQTVLSEIEAYLKTSTATQLAALWQDRTGAATPDDWAATHKMPVSVLFAEAQDAEAVVRVVAEPSAYQAEVLKAAKARLEKAALVAEDGLTTAFAARFVPAKYAALGLDVAALCAELAAKLPGNPNGWTLQGAAFYKAVAAFARGQYAAAFRPKAIEKVKALSDGEVRERLLRLVEENPDVGLKILA